MISFLPVSITKVKIETTSKTFNFFLTKKIPHQCYQIRFSIDRGILGSKRVYAERLKWVMTKVYIHVFSVKEFEVNRYIKILGNTLPKGITVGLTHTSCNTSRQQVRDHKQLSV